MRVARGPLGIPLPLMPGPKTSCGVVPEPEDYSPVLTWNLGYFWSLPSGVSPRLLGACTCAFLPSGDGYVGELLELQQGCEEPFVSSIG